MIDYTELQAKGPKGEGLEQLARLLFRSLGMSSVWTGRGPDAGKDLIAKEVLTSAIQSRSVKWLVSCKDYCQSGQSVGEADLPSIRDKLSQHNADGFLLITTTTASVAAKALLDGLNDAGTVTKVLDRAELDRLLLLPEQRDLLKQFFPNSYAEVVRKEALAANLPSLQGLPEDVVKRVTELLAPYARTIGFGRSLWPDDAQRASAFEELCEHLLEKPEEATLVASSANPDYLDVLQRVLEVLDDKGLHFDAATFAEALVKSHPQTDCALNSYEFLIDKEIHDNLKISLCEYLSESALEFLFLTEVELFVQSTLLNREGEYAAYDEIEELSSHTVLSGVCPEMITFSADGVKVTFEGSGTLECELNYDHEHLDDFSADLTFSGYFDSSGIYLEVAEADTSAFRR